MLKESKTMHSLAPKTGSKITLKFRYVMYLPSRGKTNKARQPGRHKSNQIPKGRDQRRNWTRTPQETNRWGKEASIGREGKPTTAKQTTEKGGPITHKKGNDDHGQTPIAAQAETPTQRKHSQRGATYERKQNTRPRTTDGRESTA